MRKVWPWIAGIVIVVVILAVLLGLRGTSEAYQVAKGEINARVAASQDRIDTAVEMTTAAVDLALELAGVLPSQQAQAELIKQDIEEIGNRLKDASEARGQEAIEKLDALSAQFNQTLQTVEEAARESTDPAAQWLLGQIYGILEGAQQALTEALTSQYQ
jgi:DNA anti-recombination protein RmuC